MKKKNGVKKTASTPSTSPATKKKTTAGASKRTASLKKKKKTKSLAKMGKRRAATNNKNKDKWMWTSLQHWGVIFPPEYKPHGKLPHTDDKKTKTKCDSTTTSTLIY